MTSTESVQLAEPSVEDIERAVALAARAPSIHDIQPWRFVLTVDGLELWADRRRQRDIAHLDGRALLVSCGGALHLGCLGLAAQGWRTMTERLPDPAEPDLLARIRFIGRRTANLRVQEMAAAAARRCPELRPFSPGPVSPELLSSLCATDDDPGVYVHYVRRPEERLDLAVSLSWADGMQAGDTADQHTEVPVRECEVDAPGTQGLGAVDEKPAYLVVFSRGDDPVAQLRSGEAYARLSVKAQQLGLASSGITRALDLPGVRDRFRVLMSWPDHPQMIVRVGWPPSGDKAPPTARRPLATMLSVTRPTSAC